MLHSRYDPVKEAGRYLDSLAFPRVPLAIFVTEPGESYLASILRIRFPETMIVALRYSADSFVSTDSLWDAVWRPGTKSGIRSFLLSIVTDDTLPLISFIPWTPADREWPEMATYVWKEIAAVISLQQSVMFTRSHFGERWLMNMIVNALGAQRAIDAPRTDLPVFLAAAGPTLERHFPIERERFYVCAVSSAVTCLSAHGCLPDLCVSTDGGHWARNLFRDLDPSVPLAVPLEASVPRYALERNPLVILDYGSALEREILSSMGITGERAARNGTVAGTSAEYLLRHSSSRVYAAGLDLEVGVGFSHARPHPSDVAVESLTNRFEPLSSRIYDGNGQRGALDAYASWFTSRDEEFRRRFYRLAPEGRNLPGIETVQRSDVPFVARKERSSSRIDAPLLDTPTRARNLRNILVTTRETLETTRCMKGFDAKRDSFHRILSDTPFVTEIIQMISYTGYINLARKLRTQNNDGSATQSIDELCLKAIEGVIRLERRIDR